MRYFIVVIFSCILSVPCFGSLENFELGRSFSFVQFIQSFHSLFPSFMYRSLDDSHLQKFVSKYMGLTNSMYEPDDLVQMQSSTPLSIQGNRSLRQEANDHLFLMSKSFYENFQKPLVVMSAYRSYSYQKYQISESCKANGYCAREGESEHQLGLAVDLWEATNEEKFLSSYQKFYDWLKEHAHLYGFHQSYQNGKEVDGYPIEPWHWRYVGVDLATKLYEKKITFAEYVKY